MTKALHKFYNSFGIPGYEENSVPVDAKMPYITYNVVTNGLSDNNTPLLCNLYYKSDSWVAINKKTEEISNRLRFGEKLATEQGFIILYRGDPFTLNVAENDDTSIKRKQINLSCDFITI